MEAVKLLPGKRWDGVNKVWLVPIKFENAVTRFGEAYGFKFGKKIVTSEEVAYELPPLPELTIPLKLAEGVIPYPYQKQGIARGLELK